MPKPEPGESENDYVSRCIPVVLKEGTAKNTSQAAAICHSMYDRKDEAQVYPSIGRGVETWIRGPKIKTGPDWQDDEEKRIRDDRRRLATKRATKGRVEEMDLLDRIDTFLLGENKNVCTQCGSQVSKTDKEGMCKECAKKNKTYESSELDEDGNWIQKAIKRPGALHKKLHVPEDEKIPASKLKIKPSDTERTKHQKALAKTLSGFHKKKED